MKYSSVTRDSFLGFGASAATLLQNIFKINTFSITDYIQRVNENHLPTSLTLDF
jgi:coproporphyrinogen III oxidase-like Fe-S oxidoreductase